MLQLQRASAGSGKTFTLAKKFIWFLIAVKKDDGKWRLRTPGEIADGLGRILAITFTNKATNEMKQRIVTKLADLSRAAEEEPSEELLRSVNYLKEFSESLSVSPAEIGKACRAALFALLNDYSGFHISTIDSFFQSVLRTFAYESNLSDTYQVEIDTDYLATAAIDATLDSVNNPVNSGSTASEWIRLLMDEAASSGSQWNVFQKSETPQSIYSRLRRSIHRLENEDFKEVKSEIDNYFNSDSDSDPLLRAYAEIRKRVEAPLENALKEAQENCRRLASLLTADGLSAKDDCQRWFDSHLRKLPQLRFNDSSSKPPFKPLTVSDAKPLLKKGVNSPHADEINRTAAIMYEAYSLWLSLREGTEWCHWSVYAPLLPYLGLLGEARRNMTDYLESNNMIQLGETNSMLQRIIGKDDTPFIYERLGTQINHYLIDEFQDTSRMQWENMSKLLKENDSRGEDNLIIGDAKQSIYRFRNADPSLITSAVPDMFPDCLEAGMTREDNTNWRSDRRIVEFNNFFFKALVEEIGALSKGTLDFADLYGNVVQYPSHREEKGYVEIRFLNQDTGDGDSTGDDDAEGALSPLAGIGPLISSLLQRGYRCRDIALLVDTNQLGKDVIGAIVAYNESLPPEAVKIDFISEESLLVSSAEAVGIIINVLKKMAGGSLPAEKENDKETAPRHDWNEIRTNFSFYSLRHPSMSVAEQISGFLEEDSPEEAINGMLSSMQTVALPALVEAVTENFVPENLRQSQAAFISALQDMVLEYCERYAADVASFLEWWESKGKTRSISSPEGTDAVQVMTVHKAKGLEFKCVIMPFATASITPLRKSEWRWVKPEQTFKDMGLPDYVPVETTQALEKTVHAPLYHEYFDLYMMDRLNSIYVAFTRAVSELYIFTKVPKREDASIGFWLKSICENADARLSDYASSPERELMPEEHTIVMHEDSATVTFGEKTETVEQDSEPSGNDRVLEEYAVDSSPAILQYVESDSAGVTPRLDGADADSDSALEDADADPAFEDAESEGNGSATLLPEAADNDPRSEGNLLHAVMGMMKTRDDLHRALLTLKTKGVASRRQIEEWEVMLTEALSNPEVDAWFDGRWRVINERPILIPRASDMRPDRIMVSPDKKRAIIVDYKFGREAHIKAYSRQVAAYMKSFREATGIRLVEGYIWFVKTGKVVKV